MEPSTAERRRGLTSRRTFLSASAAAAAVPLLVGTGPADAAVLTGNARAKAVKARGLTNPRIDPELRRMLKQIDPARIQAIIEKLVSFGTRHTASSQTDPNRGIGAATAYVFGEMQAIAATSGGRVSVEQQTFTQSVVPGAIPVPTVITNCIATIAGTETPERFYVITGHLDSRCTDVLDFTSDAPGADDDGSGVAVVLELLRVFAASGRTFPGTIVLATVDGEEQGTFGSAFMAQAMHEAGNDVQGMFSNDIVGASKSFDGHPPEPHTLRLFVEGVPTDVTNRQISLLQEVGGENDGVTHQLARFAVENAPFELTGMNIRTIWRRDRYLRGSDHVSFQTFGYPAGRFTEPRENFNHEHQNVQVVDGVQLGDLIDFVDFDFTARAARVNAAVLWALASNPSTPKGLEIHVNPPVNFSGTNLSSMQWNANPEPDIVGYEVVMRETTAADWTSAIDVGDVTSVTLDISKDNVQFGVRAVDAAGRRSPVAFPTVVG